MVFLFLHSINVEWEFVNGNLHNHYEIETFDRMPSARVLVIDADTQRELIEQIILLDFLHFN